MLAVLVRAVLSIERAAAGLLANAAAVAGDTANIPSLAATAPVLGEIIQEALVQDALHERADRRLRRRGSGMTGLLTILSIALAVVVVLVLASSLIVIRRSLSNTSSTLATLAGALEGVEAEHLRPLEDHVTAINAQFDIILGALPGIAKKAAVVAERRPS